MLAKIPFVRLREGLPIRFLAGNTGFSDTVRRMEKVDEPRHLELDIQNRKVWLSGIEFDLSAKELEFAFLLMFVRDLMEGGDEGGFELPRKGNAQFTISKHYLQALCELKNVAYTPKWPELKNKLTDANVQQRTLSGLENKGGTSSGMKASFYDQRRNTLGKIFSHELGKQLAEYYLPQPKDGRGGFYVLNLQPEEIQIIG